MLSFVLFPAFPLFNKRNYGGVSGPCGGCNHAGQSKDLSQKLFVVPFQMRCNSTIRFNKWELAIFPFLSVFLKTLQALEYNIILSSILF